MTKPSDSKAYNQTTKPNESPFNPLKILTSPDIQRIYKDIIVPKPKTLVENYYRLM